MTIGVGFKGHIGHHPGRRRRLGPGRMVMAPRLCLTTHVGRLTTHVGSAMAVVLPLSFSRAPMVVMVALQTGRQAQRHRPGHNSVGAHQHHCPSKTRDIFGLALA